jgi:probable rRNA maturation factor
MIKANVITKNKSWYRYIKDPNSYIDRKINMLNNKNKKLKKKNIYFTLLLSGVRDIKNLNRKFRKKNKSTDVLSFPFYKKKELQKRLINEEEIYLGDIIINFNEIKNKKKSKYFKIEFNNLWIHGLVHLFGHDHKKEKDYLIMKKIEKKYFTFINE